MAPGADFALEPGSVPGRLPSVRLRRHEVSARRERFSRNPFSGAPRSAFMSENPSGLGESADRDAAIRSYSCRRCDNDPGRRRFFHVTDGMDINFQRKSTFVGCRLRSCPGRASARAAGRGPRNGSCPPAVEMAAGARPPDVLVSEEPYRTLHPRHGIREKREVWTCSRRSGTDVLTLNDGPSARSRPTAWILRRCAPPFRTWSSLRAVRPGQQHFSTFRRIRAVGFTPHQEGCIAAPISIARPVQSYRHIAPFLRWRRARIRNLSRSPRRAAPIRRDAMLDIGRNEGMAERLTPIFRDPGKSWCCLPSGAPSIRAWPLENYSRPMPALLGEGCDRIIRLQSDRSSRISIRLRSPCAST